MTDLKEALGRVSYPGRGIVLGLHENGIQAVILYFIMGRSTNSRNRVFVTDGTGIRTEAFDPEKVEDPSLIIYKPVRTIGCDTVVTNGDQTDTVCKELIKRQAKKTEQLTFHQSLHIFDKALRRREYEPDHPNYTPRISGMVHIREGALSYAMNILKADMTPHEKGHERHGGKDMKVPSCLRFTYAYENPYAGIGHFIHTYMENGDPLPSFTGEPERVLLRGDLDEIADTAWEALDEENKVSLFVRFVDLRDTKTHDRIVNKNR